MRDETASVPSGASAVKYGSFSAYALNNHDRAAVSGYLQIGAGGATADNNAAVWAGIAGNLRITAREGQVASRSTDAVFSDFFAPNINATGKVAFMATLKPNIGGVDATQDALAAMAEGDLDVTVFQNAAGQGKGSLDTALKLARGEAVDRRPHVNRPH